MGAKWPTTAALAAGLLLATSTPTPGRDEPPVHLLVPALTGMALGRSVLTLQSADPAGHPSGRRALFSLLPASLTIPDAYGIDVGEREPYRFASPVDRTDYGSFKLLPEGLIGEGRSLSIGYATETLPASFGDSSWLVRLRFAVTF
jgi:hypothetical protein